MHVLPAARADDPDGLSERQVKARPADGDRLTEDLVGSSGVVLEDQAHSQGLAAGRRDRLANVLAFELGELLEVLFHERAVPGEGAAPLCGTPARPAARLVVRLARGHDGPIDVLCSTHRCRGDHLARCRVDDVEGLPVGRIDSLAADHHVQAARRGLARRGTGHLGLYGHGDPS